MTKYVSWDFHSSTKDALYNVLIEPVSSRLQQPPQRPPVASGGNEGRRRGRWRREEDPEPSPSPTPTPPRRGGETFESYEELVEG